MVADPLQRYADADGGACDGYKHWLVGL